MIAAGAAAVTGIVLAGVLGNHAPSALAASSGFLEVAALGTAAASVPVVGGAGSSDEPGRVPAVCGRRQEPVGLEYTDMAVTCYFVIVHGGQAAIWYPCVRPPRTCFLRTRCSVRLIFGGRA